MKAFWLITFTSVCLYTGIQEIQAQQTLTTSGGLATGSGGTVSFTAGQVNYSTYSDAAGSIAQGVQLPYELLSFPVLDDNASIHLDMLVFPNPASESVQLQVKQPSSVSLFYQLHDVNGRLLRTNLITSQQITIPTGDLPPAEYYLSITDGQQTLRTFKMIKK